MRMIQYSVWPNCTNNCDFCLRLNRKPCNKEEQAFWLKAIKENVKHIDWSEYPYGISLLGGELFYIHNPHSRDIFVFHSVT